MQNQSVKTSKLLKETEQQYMAWLLYCETGSIPKMIRAWEQLRQNIGETSVTLSGEGGQNRYKIGIRFDPLKPD